MGVSFLYAQESLEEKIPWLPVGNERYEPYGTLKAGPFRIHPFASEQVMWFDNIFLQQRYRESDFLSVTELGARADLIYDQKAFLLNLLKLKYNYYLNHSEASNFEYSYRCEGRYCLSRLLSFDGRAEYSHIVEPTEVLFAEKVERDIIDVLLGLDIKTTSDKLSFRAEVQEKNYNFSEKIYDAIDHNEFYFNGLGRYKYSEKTNFGARLGYGMLTYPEDVLNDHSYFTLGAFAEGELWTKVKYFAELGFLMQMVDVKNNPDDSEYTGPYCGISAQYIATEKWVLKAAFQRRIEYHAAVNYQVVDKLEGDFQWKIRPKIMLHLRCALELFNPSGDDPDIAAFGWRTIAGAACYYRIKDYLYAGVDYEHTRRLSHMELASYYANKFYIHITLAF
ncbi:MAG: outer membrane beta-barrel protein [Planctomycetota bacterium]|nr:outer membrane beta-barrel protein [Planctomycetota bacterium]